MRNFTHYKILDNIGMGEWTSVHKAWDDSFLQREVAIKFLREEARKDTNLVSGFLERSRALADIQSDRIIKVLQIDDSRHAVVMELADGNLGQRIQKGPMSAKEAQSLLAQCLEGLRDIHARNRLHGQIRPCNILAFPHGAFKLSDPGSVTDRALYLAPGSEKYLAPELAAKDKWLGDEQYGPKLDLYQLGFCVLEAMAGPAFDGFFPGAEIAEIDKAQLWWTWQAGEENCGKIIDKLADPKLPNLSRALRWLLAKPLGERAGSANQVLDLLGKDAITAPVPAKSIPSAAQAPSASPSNVSGSNAIAFTFEKEGSGKADFLGDISRKIGKLDSKFYLALSLCCAVIFSAYFLAAYSFNFFPFTDTGFYPLAFVSVPEGAELTIFSVDSSGQEKATKAQEKKSYRLTEKKKYFISATLKGYRELEKRSLTLEEIKHAKDGVLALKMELLPDTASLILKVRPQSAQASVDGKAVLGVSPIKVSLKSGENRVLIEKPNWETAELVARFDPIQERIVWYQVIPSKGQKSPGPETVQDLKKKDKEGNLTLPELEINLNRQAQNYIFSEVAEGFDVEVDGKSLGSKNPFEISLNPGAHKLRVQKLGYKPFEKSIEVIFDPKEKNYYDDLPQTLTIPKMALAESVAAQLKTTPPGALVEWNGQLLETPTPCQVEWKNGENRFSLFKPGFQKRQETVLLRFDEKNIHDVVERPYLLIKKEKQKVSFQIEPNDATVVQAEINKPIDHKIGIELPQGKHNFLVRKPGFRTKSFPIEIDFARDKISDPEERTEKVRLLPPGALAFQIESDPPGATVTLNGKTVDGITPLTLSLSDPKNQIVVSKEGFEDRPIDWAIDPESPENMEMGKIPKVILKPLPGLKTEIVSFPIGNGKPMDFIRIDPKKLPKTGVFTMGSPEEERTKAIELSPSEEELIQSERAHEVRLSKNFYMAKTPVTVEQFRAFIADTKHVTKTRKHNLLGYLGWDRPGFTQGPDHPVVFVTWEDAQAFCDWFNQKIVGASQRKGKVRLPTEAEWEFACRGGTNTAYSFGDKPENLPQFGNSNGESLSGGDPHKTTSPVGAYKPNPWGLFDMHGNVWQYCSDFFEEYPSQTQNDPTGPAKGSSKVVRGGSYADHPFRCRSAARNRLFSGEINPYTGFRLVYQEGGAKVAPPQLGNILPPIP